MLRCLRGREIPAVVMFLRIGKVSGLRLVIFAALVGSMTHQTIDSALAQPADPGTSVENRRKINERDFGLGTTERETAQTRIESITVEIANAERIADQHLRITTTGGAVWDQTIGDPVPPPKPGTIATIKRTALGGMMCKVGPWTTYRCIRVDKPASVSTSVAETAPPPSVPTASQPARLADTAAETAANPVRPAQASPARASAHSSPAVPPLAGTPPAPPPPGAVASVPAPPFAATPPRPTLSNPSAGNRVSKPVVASASFPEGSVASPGKPPVETSQPVAAPNAIIEAPVAPQADGPARGEPVPPKSEDTVEAQNFGLRGRTPEEKQVEVDEITAEVANVEKTADQQLRIVTTDGAVWDQTVGAPVAPPKPGTIFTIKHRALGGTMCKIDRWTSYRCIRVDRPHGN